MPRRKAIRLTAALFLAGFLTSILIAWTIELVSALNSPWDQRSTPPLQWMRFHDTGTTVIIRAQRRYLGSSEWMVDRPLGQEVQAAAILPGVALVRESFNNFPLTPHWVPELGPEHGAAAGAIARGLPFLCLNADYSGTTQQVGPGATTRPVTYSDSLTLRFRGGKYTLHLPLHPIFPGILYNTLIFAALFSTPWTVPLARRAIQESRAPARFRRGHCPNCNYDLRNDFTRPCPECGKTAIHTPAPTAPNSAACAP